MRVIGVGARMDAVFEAEVVGDVTEQANERLTLAGVDAVAHDLLEAHDELDGPAQHVVAVRGHIEQPGAPVGRMGSPLDQAAFFEMVDDGHHAAGGDMQRLPHFVLGTPLGHRNGAHHGEVAWLELDLSHQASEAVCDLEAQLRQEEPHRLSERVAFEMCGVLHDKPTLPFEPVVVELFALE